MAALAYSHCLFDEIAIEACPNSIAKPSSVSTTLASRPEYLRPYVLPKSAELGHELTLTHLLLA